MKVLAVISSLHRGGAERVVSLLSQEWAKNHVVNIAVFDASNLGYVYGGELIDLQLAANVGLLNKITSAVRRVVSLARLFNTVKPDRIISFMESANFPCILAAALTGDRSRLWVSVHNDPGRFPLSYRKLIPLMYKIPQTVVAVSKGVGNALAQLGVPKTKLLVIPNPAPPHAPSLSIALPKPFDAPDRYILGVGRLHHQKGFDRLLEAFANLADHDLHLVILGEGQERNYLKEKAQILGVSARVHMPGSIEDIWPWYRHALCFVLSSRYEGWGNVLIEAMGQKCPVIAFDCRYGPSEIICHEENGILVKEGDVDGLTINIKKTIKDKLYSENLSKNGAQITEKLSASQLAEKWTLDVL